MSTPSTQLATLPPQRQYYSHHQAVLPPIQHDYRHQAPRVNHAPYPNYATATLPAATDLRKATAANHRHSDVSTYLPPVRASQSAATEMSQATHSTPKKAAKNPDWSAFYKNGIPKEVIVIDDDSPVPEPKNVVSQAYRTTANGKRARYEDHNIMPEHAAQSYRPDPYSATQTPYESLPQHQHTASTDRTASYNTTAATSLASNQSNGVYGAAYEDAATGQKRKRTRGAAAEEAKAAKKREQQMIRSPAYFPPPHPPIKAKDVWVQKVTDRYPTTEKCDDDDGHYLVVADTELTDRYKIIRLLGQGTFGKVVEAWDREKRQKVAVKIIRSVQKYRDASRIELRVLSTLASNDKYNRNKCIHLRHCFDYRQHICIVTDLYGQSVFDFLKVNNFTPFPNTHIQTFARQLFTSVAFLHDLKLIHTDLKPENILLVDNAYQTFTYNRSIPSSSSQNTRTSRHRKVLLAPEIRLIDFGSATFDDEYHSSVVSTRHYRAPEIILNLGWSFECDIWSIGCILVEFFTGDALFQTHDNLEHLAMMEAVVGERIDRHLVQAVLDKGKKNSAAGFFNRAKKLDYPNVDTPRASKRYVKAMKHLKDIIPEGNEFLKQFRDLLLRIFVYDPKKRITAKEALKHPWFKETMLDDGTEAARIRDEKEAAATARALRQQANDEVHAQNNR